jgi:hypothetical protein
MKRGPKDGEKAGAKAELLPEEQPVGVFEEAADEKLVDAEDTGWMSMVDGDPALFIKDSE